MRNSAFAGALTIGLKNPDNFTSISAFAPICNPMECPWGLKGMLLPVNRPDAVELLSEWPDWCLTRAKQPHDERPELSASIQHISVRLPWLT